MAYFTGTLLASPVVNGSTGDTYGTHYSILGVGGYQEVLTLAQRDAIPVNVINGLDSDDLSSGRRRLGMLVYVAQTNIVYQLNIPYTTWNALSESNKVSALANNANWIQFSSGSGQGGTQTLTTNITQYNHGFSIGTAVAYSGGSYVKAISDGSPDGFALGLVTQVYDTNTFSLTQSGFLTGFTAGLSANSTYYLSDTVAGLITTTEPTTDGSYSQLMFISVLSNSGWVMPYRPVLIESGGTGGDVFTSDITVSIDPSRSFGKYIDGDIIPATGKTPKEVIQMALFQAFPPTTTLTSTGNVVTFGATSKTVNLNTTYTITTPGATINNAKLQYLSGSTWVTLSSSVSSPNAFVQTVTDNVNRFCTTSLSYRYCAGDSNGLSGGTTYSVAREQYAAPSMSIAPNGTIGGGETQSSRCNGNVCSAPSGTITATRPLALITGWTLQRRYNGGSYIDLTGKTGLLVTSTTFPQIPDYTIPITATSIDYRINYGDQYTTGTGALCSITLAAYTAPTMSITLNGTISGSETQNSRETGNVNSSPSGSINQTQSKAKITAWSLQRCYSGSGSYITLASATGLSTYTVTIPSTPDTTIPTTATDINYRINYTDENTSGVGGAQTITFKNYSYWGYNTATSLSSAQIVALANKNFLASQAMTTTFTAGILEYTYYVYPATYGDITSIILDGVTPILGAFTKLSNVTVTNPNGGVSTYKVYKSNIPGAFTSNSVAFS
jgi:hypothetical protein